MTEDTLLPFDLPAASRKKVTADFAGGLISSDGGLVLLREAERRLGLAEALAGCIQDWRDPERVVHTLPAMLRFRMFAIACGYEDADDCDALRGDPLFKLAVGRAPESGRDLCSQPTMSRLENAPSRVEVARMTAALVDVFCRSFPIPPAAITLDIDDTCDPVHGHQQLSLFNAHYDSVGDIAPPSAGPFAHCRSPRSGRGTRRPGPGRAPAPPVDKCHPVRASHPAITVMSDRTSAGVARAPMPAYTNAAMSDLPGCDCRRSLSVSGLAPGPLFSASTLARFPTRLIYRRAQCIATPWKSNGGSRVGGSGRWRFCGCRPGSQHRRRCGSRRTPGCRAIRISGQRH